MPMQLFFTAGQFASLHHINKRTLHYYDDIGLFSPIHKGENGYRYYTYQQSAQLENILSLRELGMSIDEIKNYMIIPNPDQFIEIANQKAKEIDEQIRHLKNLKAILNEKQEALILSKNINDGLIELKQCPQKPIMITPLTENEADFNMKEVLCHLQSVWECNTYKTGCGSVIAIEKVRQEDFVHYDGLFSPIIHVKHKGNYQIRPAGTYLCGYCIGSWDKIPSLYKKMLMYAETKQLKLTGYCYETGLNEIALSSPDEYVTLIEIRCEI